MNDQLQIIQGDAVKSLEELPCKSFQTIITSPPYYKQRRYTKDGSLLRSLEIGRERTSEEYLFNLIAVFDECFRVLKDDGTLWVVIDDTFQKGEPLLIPWRFVMGMKIAGWIFNTEIIWYKTNPTPQSVKNRPTRAHEYIFLFSKSKRYFYDRDAIRTPYAPSTVPRQMRGVSGHHKYSNGAPGQSPHSMSRPRMNVREVYGGEATKDYIPNGAQNPSDTKRRVLASLMKYDGANKKSVWLVTKKAYKGAHFATFPIDLIEPCILAGSRKGDIVLDPFGGSGTTARAANKHGRKCVLIELNPDYLPLMEVRQNK